MNRHVDRVVLTIGHSSHPQETFLGLLERHRVTALVDVRSVPYSRFNPHLNRRMTASTVEPFMSSSEGGIGTGSG